MVDEGRTVDASFIVLTEYRIYAFPGKQTDKCLPVATATVHGKSHFVPNLRLPFFCLILTNVVTDTLFQFLIPIAFPDKGRLDGCAKRFALVIHHGIDDAVIRHSIKFAFHLLRFDIEAGEQCAVLPERLETVRAEHALYDIGHLLLYITALVVRFFQVRFKQFLPFVLHLLQSELPFQFPAGFH